MVFVLTDLTPEKPDWRWVFLKCLAETCCVSSACTVAGVSRDTAYKHRDRFPNFRRKWDEALDVGVEALEVIARNRAVNPADPASHILLMFLLKAHRPHKYRDNGHTLPAPIDEERPVALTAKDLASLTSHDLDMLESIAGKIAREPGPAEGDDPGGAGPAQPD